MEKLIPSWKDKLIWGQRLKHGSPEPDEELPPGFLPPPSTLHLPFCSSLLPLSSIPTTWCAWLPAAQDWPPDLSPAASSPPNLSPWHYLGLSSASTRSYLTFFFAPCSALPACPLGMSAVSQHTIFPALNRTWLMEIPQQKNGWRSCGMSAKMEYYSAIKRNTFESVLMRWMNLEPIIQSKVSQKEKDKYHILAHIYEI